jgi:hypothetical protein
VNGIAPSDWGGLWHLWLRINGVLRVMLQTRWSVDAWSEVRVEFKRALHALRTWLDSWSGTGHVAVGMHRQGYDLQFTRYYVWISLTCVASRCSTDEAEDDPE